MSSSDDRDYASEDEQEDGEVMVNVGESASIKNEEGVKAEYLHLFDRIILRVKNTFTKENLLKVLDDNKWVLVITAVFFAGLLALGLTIWEGKFAKPEQAWGTIVIVFLTFLGLIRGIATPELLMMANTVLLLLSGIVNDKEALEGFSNASTFVIAVLCMVAAGIQHTGSLDLVVKYILRAPPSIWQAQLRLMVPTGIISAFINNIPQVAMQIPMIEAWCRKLQVPTSKMMIPLSWSTILGGTLCILGTSANLLVVSLVAKRDADFRFPLMEIGAVGAPLFVVGVIYITVFSKWLLPDRSNGVIDLIKTPRDYFIKMIVAEDSAVVGRTIEDAGLRQLNGLYLSEIERKDGHIHSAVSSDIDIQAEDVLTFVGRMDSVKDLWKIPGLSATTHQQERLRSSNNRILLEAVIPANSDLIGKTPQQCKFRSKYGAAIVAVHREAEHVKSKVGSIVFQKGDCLLMTRSQSAQQASATNIHSDFLILNTIGAEEKTKVLSLGDKIRMVLAPLFVALLIILNAVEVFSLLTLSLGVTFLMLLTRCLTIRQAYEALDIPLIVTIAGSFPMATALEKTGVAKVISDNLVSAFAGMGAVGPLASIYLCTMLLTALLSNNAAVALMFPIAWNMNVLSLKSRMYTLMYAASADFSTPFGYATNLMVYGPGGYKFLDYTKFGLPLQLVCMVCCVPLSYWFYA